MKHNIIMYKHICVNFGGEQQVIGDKWSEQQQEQGWKRPKECGVETIEKNSGEKLH